MIVVLGLIVVSFAIWGVGDIFRGYGRSTVAKIGNTEIGIEQFRQLFNDRVQQLGRQIGRPLTPDQARAFGLDRQLLSELVSQAALDARAADLGLNLPDPVVAERITTEPSFKAPNGQFDKARFDAIIRQAGYTEQRFVAEQRQIMLRQQIAETIAGGVDVPKVAADALVRFQNETRVVDYVVLGEAQAGTIAPPSDEALAKYFEEHKAQFRAPEYRKIVVLSDTAEDLARKITIADADAKAYYDRNRDKLGTPEKRQMSQLVFPDEAAAQAAADAIKQGKSFAEVAKERGVKDSDSNLGTLAKQDMLDPAVANAAFTLKEGETSAPVRSRFGFVLVRVGKIEPGVQQTFEQAAPAIKQQLALEQARSQASDLYNKVEDERAAGQNLTEIAAKLQLPLRTIDAIDRAGRGPDGKPVADLPKGIDLLSAAFAAEVGVDADPLQITGSYVWYEIAGITPSRERKLDEVKTEVTARWRTDQIAARLSENATALLGKLKAGTALAAAAGLKVETATGLKRGTAAPQLGQAALDAVFRTPKDQAGTAAGAAAGTRIVFVVKDASVSAFDTSAATVKPLIDRLRQSFSADLLSQYIEAVEREIGATVNQAAFNRATGASTN